MDIDALVLNILSTIIGGVLLALLFFWVRENFFALPNVMGQWYFEIKTIKSAYNPYEGMILRYTALIWREGNRIQGTVEKIYEKSSTGERNFVGENRTRGVIAGYIEKKYFTKDRVFLHVVEEGHGRESTNYYELELASDQEMNGSFTSMVADQEGEIICQREAF